MTRCALCRGIIRELPLLRDMINHLQWEVDIHSLTEQERIELHNQTMVFLHGIQDGVQPWYVDWVLHVMQALQYVEHPDYYLAFPWQGILYRKPEELASLCAGGGEQRRRADRRRDPAHRQETGGGAARSARRPDEALLLRAERRAQPHHLHAEDHRGRWPWARISPTTSRAICCAPITTSHRSP